MEEKTPEIVVSLTHKSKEHDNEQKQIRRERRHGAISGRLGLVQNTRAKRGFKLRRSLSTVASLRNGEKRPMDDSCAP